MSNLPPSSGLIDTGGVDFAADNTWTGENTYTDEVRWAIADTIVVVAATAEMPAIENGNYAEVDVSSATVAITSFATTGHLGTVVRLHFLGIITLTNSVNLELPGGTNLTTSADDELTFVEVASGQYRCTATSLSTGAAGGPGLASNNAWTGTNSYSQPSTHSNIVSWAVANTIVVAAATAEMPVIQNGNYAEVDVSSATVAITSFATTGNLGTVIRLHFLGGIILTNSVNLELPGGVNLTTATNDELTFVEVAAGQYRCTAISLASGGSAVPSGWQLLGEDTTLNGQSTVGFTSSLTGDFSRFMVVCSSVTFSSTDARLYYRGRVSGTSSVVNYDSGGSILIINTGTLLGSASTNQLQIDLGLELLNAGDPINVTIFIETPPGVLNIQWDLVANDSSGQYIKVNGGGTQTSETAFDGLQISASTGVFNAGSVRLYGLPA